MKKHLSILVAIIVFIFVVVGLVIAKQFFFSNAPEAIYGSRLEGMKDVPISDETVTFIKGAIQESCESLDIHLSGRILYVDAYVKPEVTLDVAKSFGDATLGLLTDEQKGYYDIQFLIASKTNTTEFPVIGYKHHTKAGIRWVNKKTES